MAGTKKCKVCGRPFSGEGEMGSTCAEHEGQLERYYVKKSGVPSPDEYISLVELCNRAEELGKSRYWAVKLTGGDAGVKPPLFPEFTIYKFGNRKYCRKAALKTLIDVARMEGMGKTK